MNKREMEARITVLERLVFLLLERLSDSGRIAPEDLESIVSRLPADRDTPGERYFVRRVDELFPPASAREVTGPRHVSELIAEYRSDAEERTRIFGPEDD